MRNLRQVYFRRRVKAAAFALLLIPLGIGWRMLPLHLPWLAYKYGGSFLWAVMIYWVLAALLPRISPRYVLVLAAAVALGVELSRLIHIDWLDDFRVTLAGKLLLGKYFNLRNVVVYWAAIGITAFVDRIQFWPEVLEARRSGLPTLRR